MDGSDFGVPSSNAFAGAPLPTNPLREDVIGGFINMAPRYLTGTAGSWRVTMQRPEMGYGEWSSAFGAKFTLSQLENPVGMMGYNEAYVSTAQQLIEQERGGDGRTTLGEDLGSAFHAMNPFTSNHSALMETLEAEDRDFNPAHEWEKWTHTNPELAMFLKDRGFTREAVAAAPNRDAFMFGINLELTKAQHEQEIDDFSRKAGRFARWSNAASNFAVADILFDPDTTNLIGLAGMGKVIGAGGQMAARAGLVAPKVARAIEAGTAIGGIHQAIAKANRMKHIGAIALEGGVYGVGLGFAHEMHAVEMADILEGENARNFQWDNVGFSGALGAGLGLSLYLGGMAVGRGFAKAGQGIQKRADRKRLMEAMEIDDEPIAKLGATMEGLALQHTEDEALTTFNRMLVEATTGDPEIAQVGWAMSREIVEGAGRTMDEAGALATRILAVKNTIGVPLPPKFVDDIMTEFLVTGKHIALSEAEELAVKRAMGAEHALRLKQNNPQWRAKMESSRNKWQLAADRVLVYDPDDVLTPEQIAAVLYDTRVRDIKVEMKAREVEDFILQQAAAIDNMLNGTPSPREAGAAVLNGEAAKTFKENGQYVPRTTAGRIMEEIEKLRLGQDGKRVVKKDVAELKRLQKRLAQVYPKAQPTEPVRPKNAFKMTNDEKQKVFDDVWARLQETPNEVLQGTGVVAKIMRRTFGADWLKRLVMNRSGAQVSVYSRFKPIRNLIALMGEPIHTSRMGGKGVNMVASSRRALREFGPVMQTLNAARQKMDGEQWVKFNREIKTALDTQSLLPSSHPFAAEGNQIIKQWSDWIKALQARGESNRMLRKFKEKSVYVPNRLNYGWVRKNGEEARARIAAHWRQKALDSDKLNPAVLERMGWLRKDDKGKYVPVEGTFFHEFIEKQKAADPNVKTKRPVKKDLTAEQLAEYNTAIDLVDDNGMTVFQLSARDYLLRMQAMDAFRGTAREWNQKLLGNRLARSTRTTMKRRITQREIAENPALQDIFESDLMSLGMEYAQQAGANIHMQDAINKFTGVEGFTAFDVLNQLERKAKAEWADSADVLAEITSSFENAHEKLAEIMGALPNIESQYTTVANYGFDALNKGAFMSYAGGLGLSMMPESLAMIMHKVTDLRNLGHNLAGVLRAFKSKEEMRGTIFALRAVTSAQASRFHTGALDGTFAMTAGERWLKSWRQVVDIARGKAKAPPGTNRAAATFLKTLDAAGDNLFRAGGGFAVNNYSWALAIQEGQLTAAKYLPAARKLRAMLAENPITDLSSPADQKAFRGMARKAGFGGEYDVALAFVKHDLMDDGMLEAIEAGMKATGQKRSLSLDQLQMWSLDQDATAQNAYHRIAEMVENHVRYRVPENDPLLRRTDAMSRTGMGRLLNLFQSFGTAWYTSKILNAQGMPGGKVMAGLFSLVLGEFVIGKLREMTQGRSVDEIAAEMEDDPIGAIGPYVVRAPWLGNMTPWIELGTNMVVAPERAYTPNPLAGPAAAAIRSVDRGRALINSQIRDSDRKSDIAMERTLNGLARMNWMTTALYNNLLVDAMGYTEEQDGRLTRRFGATKASAKQPDLGFDSDFDARRELRPSAFRSPTEFNLNEALMGGSP